jgi:predicted 2-oxoglutarate/Fe(II)-dependent dioxygenase YbiX
MDIVVEDLKKNFDSQLQTSRLYNDIEDFNKRKSRNAWVPTSYWIGGLIGSYIKKANDEIFKYDLENIDGESMQYTHYGIGEYYGWHQDEGISNLYKPIYGQNRMDRETITTDFINKNCEKVRKLTCILQLSDGSEYEGGAVQLRDVDNTLHYVPRESGTLFFFDSRLQHRAMKVKGGLRKSLISWVVGPRWK